MKISDIKKGRKYYNLVTLSTTNRPSGKKKRQVLTMLIVEVDLPGKRVCASMNGFPAKWYTQQQVNRWTEASPEECTCSVSAVENFTVCEKHCDKNLKKK